MISDFLEIKNMKILCVIPARSGSKGIVDKNIKNFQGKPLLAHTIDYSNNSKCITKTIVSTDSPHYAKIANKYGALTPFIRPSKFSKDTSQDIDFIKHALTECENFFNMKFELVILLRPTSPIRSKGLIEKGLKMIINDKNADSLKAVTEANEHPYRHWVKGKKYISGYEKSIFEPYNLPRQQLPKTFYSAGDLEIIRRKTILEGSVSGKKIIPLILNKNKIVDIDNEEDWIRAEQIFNKAINK